MIGRMEEFQFQAETRTLLNLMIHSLYTQKDIFLRELISNASDALDRLRFESLTRPDLLAQAGNYEIRLEIDTQARILSVVDTGIGMSREEVIANIGTIAKSGTRELRERIRNAESPQAATDLIGQFGVGFYSSFMVADRVRLITRKAGDATATFWESTGDGVYTIGDAEAPHPGTTVSLYLKPVDPENGLEDYTDQWVLSRIVKKHSDFIAYPILFRATDKEESVAPDKAATSGPETALPEEKALNSMKPIWERSSAEVAAEEYAAFYRRISQDWKEPFKTIALKAEGTLEYQALLFIPAEAPYDLFYHASQSSLRLYARKVMVIEDCNNLLPNYLRFIKGVVDSADLPLNISRQMLQQDRHIAQMRRWLTRKVLDALQDLYVNEQAKYLHFWSQFGRALKEGVTADQDNKDRILSLLLFQSSHHKQELTSLQGYLDRMKEGQAEIYYLTGESRTVVENSPHLEAFNEKGYEVLYLTDPVDELLMQSVPSFEGKLLKSVGKGAIDLAQDEEEKDRIKAELQQKEIEASAMLAAIQKAIEDHVKQVRLSSRLVSSPSCLVGAEMDYSPHLERLLQKGKGGGAKQRRILELNPRHEVFTKMLQCFKQNAGDDVMQDYAELLLGYSLLAEGSELPDPPKFSRLIAGMMVQTLENRISHPSSS